MARIGRDPELSEPVLFGPGYSVYVRAVRLALEDLLDEKTFLTGEDISLADLHAAPMFAYFDRAPAGRHLIAGCPGIARWWTDMPPRCGSGTPSGPCSTCPS